PLSGFSLLSVYRIISTTPSTFPVSAPASIISIGTDIFLCLPLSSIIHIMAGASNLRPSHHHRHLTSPSPHRHSSQ
ncbi:hypothetical protein, partial [Faecalibaculum rodentium]